MGGLKEYIFLRL